MKTQKFPRILIIGAVLVALGAAGYAFRDTPSSNDATSAVAPSSELEAVRDDDAVTQVDVSLGRQSNVATTSEKTPPLAEGAPGGAVGSSPDQTSTSGDGGSTANNVTDDGRKIVQTASLKMQVDTVVESFEEVSRIATASGGFVASSNFSNFGDNQIASISIRVPASRHQEVLAELRGLGSKVDSEVSNSNDVSEEYADLSARIRNLEATEAQLLTLLGQARSINDILTVQDRLNSTRGQIEQVKGRMQLLDNLTEMTTISVHLRPVIAANTSNTGPATVDLGAKVSEAWDDSIRFLSEIAGGVITVVVFGWWLPLVAVPAYVVLRRLASRPGRELADGPGAA